MNTPHPPVALALLATLALAASPAEAGIVEVWSTPHPEQYTLYDIADLDGNGSLELLTSERVGQDIHAIGVRSASSGALLAQASNTYEVSGLFLADLDGNGNPEILFTEDPTGRLYCLRYEPGLLEAFWSIRPSVPPPFNVNLADLDGDGRLYLVLQLPATPGAIEVYDHRGGAFGTYTPSVEPQAIFEAMLISNFDSDPGEEIMLIHRDGAYQQITLVESGGQVGVNDPPGVAGLRAVQLGASIPNPAACETRIAYTVAKRGPATLRLLDVSGREMRVLVSGEVAPGFHEAQWDGRDSAGRMVPAGMYFYELSASGERTSRRVIRLP